MYKVIEGYRDNESLRHSFNELAIKTFKLNFEDWYQNGFWGDNYNPHSIVIDGKIVANISVNKTTMLINGKEMNFLQLGTVMTDKEYRNRGLSRTIMEHILNTYQGQCDGIYLFGSDSVIDFYPKFGFVKGKEYQYFKKVTNIGGTQMKKVIMDNSEAWEKLLSAMNTTVFHGKCDLIHNNELIMFYVSKFMKEDVYYHESTQTYVIAEIEDDSILIHNVFSDTLSDLDEVIRLFGESINSVTLGFTPLDSSEYEVKDYHEDDCTFFILGDKLNVMEKEKLMIPLLAHA